jgi:VIT1/CCC1 family predicted Fe2+/Mn2+ transporter
MLKGIFSLFNRKKREYQNTLFRNFIFGVEDSLVSTVGLLSGVATADTQQETVVLTGIILIFVEAFSMGVGSFLSEDNSSSSDHSFATHRRIATGSLVMFISYLIAGIIPLSPYIFFIPSQAIYYSIGLTFLCLVSLGIYSSKRNHNNSLRSVIEMLLLGGFATLIGIAVGSIIS